MPELEGGEGEVTEEQKKVAEAAGLAEQVSLFVLFFLQLLRNCL